jgi:AcrR family transcriptional regulator
MSRRKLLNIHEAEAAYAQLNVPRIADKVEGKEEEIIVAAFHCIAEIGIAATSTHAVAKRAELNQGSIHYYFRNKDQLLLAVLQHLMKNKASIIREIRNSSFSPSTKVYCVLKSGTVFLSHGDEVLATISLWAHALSKGGRWTEVHKELFAEIIAECQAIIDEGIASGEFRDINSKALAESIITAVQGIGMHYMMNPADFTEYGVMDRLVEMFLKTVTKGS